jgi:uncharacterized repeat protein (TIGR03803 family)
MHLERSTCRFGGEMKVKHLFYAACGISAFLSASYPAEAASESVIHSFPSGSLVLGQPMGDPSGHLYGTSYLAGEYGDGYVYELIEKAGVWRSKTIFSFNRQDGANPYAGVAIDRATGILYGTTVIGGAANAGTIFSLKHSHTGWIGTVLHDFASGGGSAPYGLLTRDLATGVLYGTATSGGSANCGTAYQIDPRGNFQVLYNFLGGNDGCGPDTQLREGTKSGLLLGSTEAQGQFNAGTLFLLKERTGVWSESVIHQFTGGNDGAGPKDLTEIGSDGVSLYGIASSGGAHHAGVVFQLVKTGDAWGYSVIYTFTGGSDGSMPAGLHLDSTSGVLYGTTTNGGSGNGVVFKLVKNGQSWTETVLHSFGGSPDGAVPYSRPYLNPRTGQLFGTTGNGGTQGNGTAYVVIP